ncbi:hypothetical protein [Candidatus Spongiihabitans sp.]|uniref:hypothetical protein n=1 Tax=Candidatus Spongiihabitans sp. TaxID=3101308 RepID=UPI003C6F3CFA
MDVFFVDEIKYRQQLVSGTFALISRYYPVDQANRHNIKHFVIVVLSEYFSRFPVCRHESTHSPAAQGILREEFLRIVIHGLRKQWSPAQIRAKHKLDYPGDERMRACAETIYTYLYALPGGLRQSLLRCLRRHRNRGIDHRGGIPEMFSIE